jgi:hypothetical protein
LKAQIAALTSGDPEIASHTRRDLAAAASLAVASYVPPAPAAPPPARHFFGHAGEQMFIDPALQGADGEAPARSPWASPGIPHGRRQSEYPLPSPGGDSPHSPNMGFARPYLTESPFMGGNSSSSSLTRMVADAALRTGHAANHVSAFMPTGSSVAGSTKNGEGSGSERGSSVKHSPADNPDHIASPENVVSRSALHAQIYPSRPPSIGNAKPKKRAFNVPPLPPQPAVERLVAAYVDFVGVTSPIIHIPSLGKQLIRVREGTDVEQSDVFVVMMVLGELHLSQ